MLASGYSTPEIEDILGTTRGVVSQISSCSNHLWLEHIIPNEYNIIKQNHELYNASGGCLLYKTGMCAEIFDIHGTKHIVHSIASFSRQHNLDSGNLSKLISGKLNTYKGFYTKASEVPNPSKVISPEGEVYIIPARGISIFAKTHNLDNSILSKVLKGKLQSHRGWKKYNE